MNSLKLFFIILFTAIFAKADHMGIPIQLKLKAPGGTYPTESGVNFTLMVLSPASGCILREETFSSQNVVEGAVSLTLGSGLLGPNDPGLSLMQIYDNSTAKSGLACIDSNNNVVTTGQSYTPASGDKRVIRISTVLMSETVIVNFNMRSVPYAIQADAVGGKSGADILVKNGSSQLNQNNLNNLLLDATRLSNLLAVATTGSVSSAGSFSGVLAGDVSGGQSSTSVDKIKGVPVSSTAPSAGQILQFNGSQYVPANLPSAAVTSVAGRTGAVTLSTSDISGLGSGAVLNAGSLSGDLVQLDGAGKIPSSYLPAVSSTVVNLDGDVSGTTAASVVMAVGGKTSSEVASAVTDVQGASSVNAAGAIVKRDSSGNFGANAISSSSNSTFNLYLYDSINSVRLKAPSGLSSSLVLTLPSSAGSSGQFLQTDGSGNLSWSAVSIPADAVSSVAGRTGAVTLSSSDISGLGTAASQNVGVAAGNVVQLDGSAKVPLSAMPASVIQAVSDTTAATSANVPDAIVKRDASGDIAVGLISASDVFATNVMSDNSVLRSGSNSITLKAPAGLTSDLTLNLPASNGSAGQVLLTDGAGNLSWASVSAAGGSVTSVTASAPLSSSGGSSPNISMTQASSSSAGYLSSSDWSTFNSKQAALGFTPLNVTAYNADLSPAASCTTSQTPYWNTVSDTWACQSITYPVTSVAGRTGAVTLVSSDISGLGSAAVLNAGVAAGDVVQLDGTARIPASTLPANAVTTSTALSGDVTGTVSTVSVDRIKGVSVSAAAPVAGQALVYDGTRWVPAYGVPSFSRKTTDQALSVTATANITGMSFPVAAGFTYKYKFHIAYTSVATNTGFRVGLNYPAVTMATGLANIAAGADGTGAYFQGVLNSSGDSVMSGTSSTNSANGMYSSVEGIIMPSAAGTVQLIGATEINGNNIVIKAGSFVEYSVVP